MEIYFVNVEQLAGKEDAALALLSPARREKAERLRSGPPRLQSLGAGLLLRHVFGPRDPAIAPGGKPFFSGEAEFCLSHSGRFAALAVSGEAVGLDLETVAPVREAVIRRVLTPEERRWLADAGEAGFAFLWTRKEAALKLLGTGVDRSLRSFRVLPEDEPMLDGRQICLRTVRWEDCVLTAAAEAPFSLPELRELPAEELLT